MSARELGRFQRYLEVERGLAPGTVDAYAREIRAFLDCADFPDVRAFILTHGGSAASVTRRLAALRAWFRFQGQPDATADVARPKRRRGAPRPVRGLSEALEATDGLTRAVVTLLAETGLRISEACAVHCPFPPPTELVVRGKGGRDRVVPLTPAARRALAAMGGRIPWSKRQVQRRLSALGFTPHQLRHTFATNLAARDVDLSVIQDLLGHASPATTRVYQENSPERLRRGMGLP